MNRIAIEAKRDFLERLSSTTPIKAVAELIWNGLDAGAEQVSVRLEVNALDGLEAIRVTDTGHGINESLGYEAGRETAREYLANAHARFIPDLAALGDDEQSPADNGGSGKP